MANEVMVKVGEGRNKLLDQQTANDLKVAEANKLESFQLRQVIER